MDNKKMARTLLDAAMRKVYACHGRSLPAEPVLDAIWDAVPAEAPNDFAEFVRADLSDRADLPRNLPRAVRREIWPAFLASTASGAATGGEIWDGRPGCPECGGRGWHRCWPSDAVPGDAPTAIPCTCNAQAVIDTDGLGIDLHRWSRADLEASGAWRWTDPAEDGLDPATYSRERILEALKATTDEATPKAPAASPDSLLAGIIPDDSPACMQDDAPPF